MSLTLVLECFHNFLMDPVQIERHTLISLFLRYLLDILSLILIRANIVHHVNNIRLGEMPLFFRCAKSVFVSLLRRNHDLRPNLTIVDCRSDKAMNSCVMYFSVLT